MTLFNTYIEIIVYNIAKLLGLNCAVYDLALYDHTVGNITKDFKKANKRYITLEKFINYAGYNKKISEFNFSNNLENICDAFNFYYQDFPNKDRIVQNIMEEIIDLFSFDILIANNDRHLNNIIIEQDIDTREIHLAPMFDHTDSLQRSLYSKIKSKYSNLSENHRKSLRNIKILFSNIK